MNNDRALVVVGGNQFASPHAAPLVRESLRAIAARCRVIYAIPENFPLAVPAPIESIAIPAHFAESWRVDPLWPAKLIGSAWNASAPWAEAVRRTRPAAILALSPQALWAAHALSGSIHSPVGVLDTGGVVLRQLLHAPNEAPTLLMSQWLPHFLRVGFVIHVEDTTRLYSFAPTRFLPPRDVLRLPIPTSTWPDVGREIIDGRIPARRRFRITWAGRYTNIKRPDYFVQMARELFRKRDDVEVVLAGSGLRDNELPREARAAGLDPSRTHVIGALDYPGLVSLLRSSDLAVFTSRFSVAGTIFREAVENGIPVAATMDVSDILVTTMLVPFRHIIQLPYSDARDAAEEISSALDEPAALRNRALHAKKHALPRSLSAQEFADHVADFVMDRVFRVPGSTSSPTMDAAQERAASQ